jgi:hypothetical protein
MNRFEVFIQEGLSEDNPYSEDEGYCIVCEKVIKGVDTSYIIRQAVEVILPPSRDPAAPKGCRVRIKDSTISPILGDVCSLLCSEMWILQHI